MVTRTKWANPDGLDVFFGPRPTENQVTATAPPANGTKTIKFNIRGEDIPAVTVHEARNVVIPAGSRIISSTLVVQEAFVGATATLDVGTITASTGVALDDDGLHAAVTVASMTAGAVIVGAGAQIGTVITVATRIGYEYDTAAFTAGSAELTVVFAEPPVQTS